jgi:hypothetical protein
VRDGGGIAGAVCPSSAAESIYAATPAWLTGCFFPIHGVYLFLGIKMAEIERDQNLMLVYAVEGYSLRHNLPEKDVIILFRKYGIGNLIRKNYNVLHTQDLDDCIAFAEDVLSWKEK